MVAPAIGGVDVMRWNERRLMRLVTILGVCAALGLAACGRKGDLERPSAAAAGEAAATAPPPQSGRPPTWNEPPQGDPSSPPIRRRPFILDPLLN
jgi:predicted small lipoprotein YifL